MTSHNSQPVPDIAPVKVAIALCTRERPHLLRRCLMSLMALDLPAGVQAAAVVVENSEVPSCRSLVEEIALSATPAWQIIYVHEPRLGIPIARNRSVDVALDLDPDWIAFIDDDEEAEPGWLTAMLNSGSQHNADVVQGPVDYRYGPETPDWITAKKIKRRASGTRLQTAFTNNVMMKAAIARSGLRFDETLRFSGGEDSDFFHRVAEAGWVLCWASDAIVSEVILPSRLTMRWQLQRAMREAANAAQSHINRKGRRSAILIYGPKGIRRMLRGSAVGLAGVALLPFSRRLGKRTGFIGLRDIWSGAGGLIAFLGLTPQPYTRIDGM